MQSTPKVAPLAKWSLALTILGAVFCLPAFGGIVCGFRALNQIGKSKGTLRGTGLAIFAIVGSIFSALSSISLITSLAVPVLGSLKNQTLAEARANFATRLTRLEKAGFPVPLPPAEAVYNWSLIPLASESCRRISRRFRTMARNTQRSFG